MSERFTFFWGGPFSQWHPCTFRVEGMRYNCAEQYMMQQKALLFGDTEMAAEIMSARHPRRQKALGRQVRRFNGERWAQVARDIVFRGNLAKFTQDAELQAILLATAGTTLVEASPRDSIWGIGLAEDDPRAQNRSSWRGTNWLGEVLTRVRETILQEQSLSTAAAPTE